MTMSFGLVCRHLPKSVARMASSYIVATCPLSIALSLSVSIGVEGSKYIASMVIISSIFFGSIIGRAILALLRTELPASVRVSAEVIIGVAVLSVLMLTLAVTLKCSANESFLLVCGFSVIMLIHSAGRWDGVNNITSRDSFVAISIISTLSVIWSWQAIWAYSRMRQINVYPAWPDFFFHSSMITQFAHFSDLREMWVFAIGTHIPLYHYASYMLPAAINALSGLPALYVASAFTEPFSFMVMGLGAWTLGVVMGGRTGGVASIAAIFLLPDAAHYGFENPIYDFHWLLQITSIGYTIGISLLVLALGFVAFQERSSAAFGLAFALTLISASFKIQIFALLFLSGLALWALFWRPRRTSVRVACLGALAVGGALSIGVAELLPRAPHFLSTHWEPRLALLGLLAPGTIGETWPGIVAIPVGLATLLLTAFGVLVPLYALGIALSRRKHVYNEYDIVPFVFVIVYIIMLLVFPQTISNEFQHRPFVLVYAVLAVWCACLGVRVVEVTPRRCGQLVFGILGLLALLPFPFVLQKTVQTGHAAWMRAAVRNPIPPGLQRCAEYIRRNAAPSDITQKSNEDGEVPKFGAFIAMSERGSFVLLMPSDLAWTIWGMPLDIIRMREAVNKEILRAQSFEEFSQLVKAAGINWYLLSPSNPLPKVITDMAVMVADGYYLFHIEPKQ